jgi:hypothetical protein
VPGRQDRVASAAESLRLRSRQSHRPHTAGVRTLAYERDHATVAAEHLLAEVVGLTTIDRHREEDILLG